MDKIHFRNMAFFGYHGCLDFEQAEGQHFLVDLVLGLDLRPAGQSDDLADTVNYARVFESVRHVVEEERFNLLEALAERIAARLFKDFPPLQEIRILLKKPEAPIDGNFDYVGIEIERLRPPARSAGG